MTAKKLSSKKKPKASNNRRGRGVRPSPDSPATIVPGSAEAPQQFDVEKTAKELGLYWEDGGGDSFWIQSPNGVSKWPKGAIEDRLTEKFVRAKRREGEFLSDQERLLLHVRNDRCVDMVMWSLSGYPSGLYDLQSGHKVIVKKSAQLIDPIEGEWGVVRALIESKLDLRPVGGPNQSDYFHGWLRAGLEALMYGGPGNFRPGQCCIFAGPADSGKSRIQHQIVTGLLGGRSANPGPYLFGKTDFNAELFSAEHLMMEDPASSTKTQDRVYFGEQLKQLIVNDTHRFHQKREDALTVSPFFRTTISVNDDPDKMRVLPLLTKDMKDKVNLFLVSAAPLPLATTTLGERKAFCETIGAQLSAYAFWLLNTFEIPEELRSVRFGVREWHHPALVGELFDDTPAAELLRIIDAAEFGEEGVTTTLKLWQLRSHRPAGTIWEGTAIQLGQLLTGEALGISCSVAREAKGLLLHNKLDRMLARLKEDQGDRVIYHRGDARRWMVACPCD